VVGIGRAKAEKIWFRALDAYFTSNTRYVNTTTPANTSRAYTLSAATDLYGVCSTEYKTVQAAWTSVNVAGNDAACPTANDHSVAVAPASATVDQGGSTSATVTTAVVNGTAQTVTFSASGLPTGATATFSPASVTAGGTATVTISTSSTTPAGSYSVSVIGTSSVSTRSAAFALTVNGPPGCTATNATDVEIPDNTTVESTVTINGCGRSASAASTVEVHIVHTYVGDLIDATFTTNLSSEAADGTWRLRVQDAASADTGYVNSWTLTL